jgi:hypothetical protein
MSVTMNGTTILNDFGGFETLGKDESLMGMRSRERLLRWPAALALFAMIIFLSQGVAHANEVSVLATCVQEEATDLVTAPVREIAPERIVIGSENDAPEIPAAEDAVLRNHSQAVDTILVMVHGEKRNAGCYVDYGQKMREMAVGSFGIHSTSVGILAPQFLIGADLPKIEAEPDGARLAYWQDKPGLDAHGQPNKGGTEAWQSGRISADFGIDSYGVLDALLTRLSDRERFPALRHVVLIGFSAGAQAVQRYIYVARGTKVLFNAGITTEFVVGSPDSYAWPTRVRPHGVGGFSVPTPSDTCDADDLITYDDWKYGLEGTLPPAFDGTDLAQLARLYPTAPVRFLVGGDDRGTIDKSCAGAVQGSDRLMRAQGFVAFTAMRDPERPQTLGIVPNATHDPLAVLASREGVEAAFTP